MLYGIAPMFEIFHWCRIEFPSLTFQKVRCNCSKTSLQCLMIWSHLTPPHKESTSLSACVLSRFSCVWLLQPYGLCPWHSLGKNTGVGFHVPIQGLFPTQGSNPHIFCLLLWQGGSLPLAPPGKQLPLDFQENLMKTDI